MKHLLLAALLLLTGCVTMDNRVACTVAMDKAFFISQYGGLGISSEIAEADAEAICRE